MSISVPPGRPNSWIITWTGSRPGWVWTRAAFREQYYHLALCRNLQILGAYGYLTKAKGKDQFARYIPTAVESLHRRLLARPGAFPRLEELVASLEVRVKQK